MNELHDLTIQWAKDRRIIPNSLQTTQALKLGSEFGELCGNLARCKPIEDDVGDCLVVCTILAQLGGFDLLEVLSRPVVQSNRPIVPMAMKHLGDMQDNIIKDLPYSDDMMHFLESLRVIAGTRDATFLESWEIAYADIKDRTGTLTPEGNFIKDTK